MTAYSTFSLDEEAPHAAMRDFPVPTFFRATSQFVFIMLASAENTAEAYPHWYKHEPNAERDRDLVVRQEKRAEIAAARARVEELRQKGRGAFEQGCYLMAKEYYNQAFYFAVGQRATASVLLDLARTYLKLRSPEAAERFATSALELNPKNAQARCVRGHARRLQNRLSAAIIDYEIALALIPRKKDRKDARDGRRKVLKKQLYLRENGIEEPPADPADEHPRIPGDIIRLPRYKIDEDAVSDTSDYNHEANGIPCRRYNQSRCGRGELCDFSHGPTKWAIRDQLGRNVCVPYLLGDCPHPLEKCYYSHSTAYLASVQAEDGIPIEWWTRPDIICDWRRLRHFCPAASRIRHRQEIRARRARAALRGDGSGTRTDEMPDFANPRSADGDSDDEEEWSSDDDEELYGFGFSKDAHNELLSQGVKPWDDDAYAALGAIRVH